MKDSKHFRFEQINRAIEKFSNDKDFVNFLGQHRQSIVQEELIVIQKNGEFLAIPQQGNTKEKGIYEGEFTINFSNDLTSETTSFPSGELIMPIREKLIIKIEWDINLSHSYYF